MSRKEVLAVHLVRGRKSLRLYLEDGGSQAPFRHGARIASDGPSYESEGLAERAAGQSSSCQSLSFPEFQPPPRSQFLQKWDVDWQRCKLAPRGSTARGPRCFASGTRLGPASESARHWRPAGI